jgi:hypothetical protein
MLLCDSAQVAEQKLYVLGGGISIIGPDPVFTALAIKIEVPWNQTDVSHHWVLFLEDADGRPVMVDTTDGKAPLELRGEFVAPRPDIVPEGTPADAAMAFGFGPFPLEPGNRYIWRLSIDGESEDDWSVAFTVRPRQED